MRWLTPVILHLAKKQKDLIKKMQPKKESSKLGHLEPYFAPGPFKVMMTQKVSSFTKLKIRIWRLLLSAIWQETEPKENCALH